ncbi:filamin-C-like [Cottoperca gobio]|uniref:Filamin-C-like n=1 Tax=Cottoperca gobio TaxID=56716 RepID=A0A6J2P9R8_COTGO|nr:filamin-C-like [Cottoperca gobio]
MMSNSGYLEPQLPPQFFQSSADISGEEEEEMPATEKDLAEDAPWKKIQQNTFTRWCNEHLKVVNKRINDLQKDLSDGLKLIGLLEVLSQKKMYRKYHSRPNFRQMKLENVSVALEFLEREHIRLVSIGEWKPAESGHVLRTFYAKHKLCVRAERHSEKEMSRKVLLLTKGHMSPKHRVMQIIY